MPCCGRSGPQPSQRYQRAAQALIRTCCARGGVLPWRSRLWIAHESAVVPAVGLSYRRHGSRRDSLEVAMTRDEVTQAVVAARLARRLSWQDLADAIGKPVVWVVAALLGQHPLD